jgi:hypothetical protein
LYEREACVFTLHNFDTTWAALSHSEKAAHVAHYLLHNIMEAHANDAQQAEMDRKK